MYANKVRWTVWRGDAPVRETINHLVDDANNWSRGVRRTLCGREVGRDSTFGDDSSDCAKCWAKARKLGLEVKESWR